MNFAGRNSSKPEKTMRGLLLWCTWTTNHSTVKPKNLNQSHPENVLVGKKSVQQSKIDQN